jgi:hypothetical protein
VVGRVKRSPWVQRLLYRPLDTSAIRPDEQSVDYIRAALDDEITGLETRYHLGVRTRWGWP